MDDERDTVDALKNILERKGYEVNTAYNGVEALEHVREAPFPNLILLDIQMPDMNGYTFMFELYREENRRAIPVIVVSAYSEMEPIFSHRGVKDYLVKPVQPEELLEKVSQYIS